MEIYCTNCGKEIVEGMAFCTECGTPASKNTREIEATPPPTYPPLHRAIRRLHR